MRSFLQQVLGPHTVVGDRSWDHGEALVLEVEDRDGARWYAKQHRSEKKYWRELAAYQDWVPRAFGDRAPVMRAHDDELRIVVLSKVAGVPLEEGTERVHRQAGELLRRLHDLVGPEPWPDPPGFAEGVRRGMETWIDRGGSLLSKDDLAFCRRMVAGLSELPPAVIVPCHMDYSPRNWLVDDAGVVRLIDFERTRREQWIQDLARMHYGLWLRRPELGKAFYEGYGRQPSGLDLEILDRRQASGTLSTIVWAHEHGDEAFEAHGREVLAGLRERYE